MWKALFWIATAETIYVRDVFLYILFIYTSVSSFWENLCILCRVGFKNVIYMYIQTSCARGIFEDISLINIHSISLIPAIKCAYVAGARRWSILIPCVFIFHHVQNQSAPTRETSPAKNDSLSPTLAQWLVNVLALVRHWGSVGYRWYRGSRHRGGVSLVAGGSICRASVSLPEAESTTCMPPTAPRLHTAACSLPANR